MKRLSAPSLLTSIFFTSIAIISVLLHCSNDNPSGHLNNPIIDIKISVNSHEDDERNAHEFFVGESITVFIELLETEPVDSLFFGMIDDTTGKVADEETLQNFIDSVLTGSSVKKKNEFTVTFDHPMEVLLAGVATADGEFVFDTLRLQIVENEDANTAPELTLSPVRAYATPSLPCTLTALTTDEQQWQKVFLSAKDSSDSIIISGDTLVIWTPKDDDSLGAYALEIIATDNSSKPEATPETVILTVVEDDFIPLSPEKLVVTQRTDDSVTITWNTDSLADGYTVWRSSSTDDNEWDSIATTTAANFTDTTSDTYFYRVTSENYFGSSDPAPMVLAADTLHYGHEVSFSEAQSTALESDSAHTVTLTVSKEALMPITVYLSASGEEAATETIALPSTEATIDSGETSVELSLSITDDELDNGPETLTVTIDSVSTGFTYGTISHEVVVTDNDTFYTVTYDANGADEGEVPEDENRYKKGTSVTVLDNSSNLEKEGCSFDGWNTKADGKESGYVADAVFDMPGKSITLFAQWTPNRYEITYNGNGNDDGTAPADTFCRFGEEFTLADNLGELIKTGYVFGGWNSAEDGSGTRYPVDSSIIMEAGDLQLFARWAVTINNVTYYGNNNSEGTVPETIEFAYGDTVAIHDAGNLSRIGYTFTGWNTQEDGKGTPYNTHETFVMGIEPVSLYAQWDINSYTITYDGNGNTGGDVPGTTTHEYATTVTVKDNTGSLEKTGHHFTGWDTLSESGTAKYSAGSTFSMGAADDTLYAQWEKNQYTVTYDGNGNTSGNVPEEKSYDFGTEITVYAKGDLSRENYQFAGWDTVRNGGGTLFTEDENFTLGAQNVTLYAQWNRIYTVTFDGRTPATGPNPASMQVIEPATTVAALPTPPTKTGCTFAGWYTEIVGDGSEFTDATEVTADIAVYALWTMTDQEGNVYKTVQIGEQLWMAENLKTKKYHDGSDITLITETQPWLSARFSTPGYCWYDNVEINNGSKGILYNWHAVNTGKLAPDRWHVPDTSEWIELQNYLITNGYNWDETGTDNKIGKSLASITGWAFSDEEGNVGNDTLSNNSSGFSAISTGIRYWDGIFDSIGYYAAWWSTQESNSTHSWFYFLRNYNSGLHRTVWGKGYGFSIRCLYGTPTFTVKFDSQGSGNVESQNIEQGNTAATPTAPSIANSTFSGWYTEPTCMTKWNFSDPVTHPMTLYAGYTVSDYEGNRYKTVLIGEQRWMAENLKSTKYNNGNVIPLVTDETEWGELSSPGYCWYKNDESYKETYGGLYNWFTVNTGKIAPEGWHVPSDSEWTEIENYSGGSNVSGGKLKEIGTEHWNSPNEGATNEFGFSALPTGYRSEIGTFDNVGIYGPWWSATQYDSIQAWYRNLYYDNVNLFRGNNYNKLGLSIRCLLGTPKFTVKFNSQGGTAVASQVVVKDNLATKPAQPTRNYYTFTGWYTEPSCTNKWSFSTAITSPLTLYVGWTPNTYKVTFEMNDGNATGTMNPQEIVYGASANLAENKYAKTGYSFAGWATDAGGALEYGDKASYTMTSDGVTLYAVWQINSYKVTYNANSPISGSAPSGGDYPYKSTVTVQPNSGKLEQGSSSFAGWNTQPDGSGTYYACGAAFTLGDGPAILYAIYSENTVMDNDGNLYTAVTIGSQVWMVENLKTTKYNNGTPIPLIAGSAAWGALSTPGYCWYDNDSSTYNADYGILYNWFTVNTGNLAPAGWHIPTDAEWAELTDGLGGDGVAGAELKEAGSEHWNITNKNGNNNSGFTALPGGSRTTNGSFYDVRDYGNWWTADENDDFAYNRELYSGTQSISSGFAYKKYGFSVRCVKD